MLQLAFFQAMAQQPVWLDPKVNNENENPDVADYFAPYREPEDTLKKQISINQNIPLSSVLYQLAVSISVENSMIITNHMPQEK